VYLALKPVLPCPVILIRLPDDATVHRNSVKPPRSAHGRNLFSASFSLPQLCAAFPSQSTRWAVERWACVFGFLAQIFTEIGSKPCETKVATNVMNAQPQPAARNLGGRPPGINRRRRELVASFVEALGGRVSAVQKVEIERCASLLILAEDMRAKAFRGENVSISDLSRLEGTCLRALQRLNLPASGAASAPVPTLADYLASKQAATEEADG
jgi:hypothetical protein